MNSECQDLSDKIDTLLDVDADTVHVDVLSDLLCEGDDTDFADLLGDIPEKESSESKESLSDTVRQFPTERKARRRAQLASSSRRLRLRKKIEIADLKSMEFSLTEQLNALKTKNQAWYRDRCASLLEQEASTEYCKRQQAERDNRQLRQILYQQNCYLRSFKADLASTIGYHAELNMFKFLHTTTHLPMNSQSRLQHLEAVCTEAKLDLATQILLNETLSTRPYTTPSFSWEPLDVGTSEFGVTSVVVFALDTSNVCEAFQAASTAIINCAVVWPKYSLTNSSVNQMDIQSTKLKIRYSTSEHRFQSGNSREQVLLESRDISYCRLGGEGSVFLWDVVDEDDLFPLKKDAAVKRSTVGALLVRPELCDDGVERVVCRYICSKIHMIGAAELPPDIKRFSRSKTLSAQVADSMVYETIKGDVAEAFNVV